MAKKAKRPPPPTIYDICKRGWDGGLPYTKNGPGSLPAITAGLVQALPAFLRKHGFTSVADLGCGDMNWAAQVDWAGIEYVGVDYMRPVNPPLPFVQGDILKPQRYAQVALCRHVMIHMTNQQALAFLKAVNADYLLATTDVGVSNSDRHKQNIHPSYSAINLEAAPFSLTRMDAIPELVPGQLLGLFKLRV